MKKAYFCIDGFSFKRINDFYKYEHKRHSRLNISALEGYLRYEIARRLGLPSDSGNLLFEKHFYHPSPSPRSGLHSSYAYEAMLRFESSLLDAQYAVHYSQKQCISSPEPNENLFADSMVATQLQKIDMFILLTTQKQHVNILQHTNYKQIPNILVCWSSVCKNSNGEKSCWKTDRLLREHANIYFPLEKVLNLPNSKHPIVEVMFHRP